MKMNVRLIIAIITNIIEIIAIILVVQIALPKIGLDISFTALLFIILAWIVFSVTIYRIGSRALDRQVKAGLAFPPGSKGVVVKELSPEGTIKIEGEYWRAYCAEPVASGREVEVVNRERMVLVVRPVDRQV
jgi:membrane-bound ClpP family serine protease